MSKFIKMYILSLYNYLYINYTPNKAVKKCNAAPTTWLLVGASFHTSKSYGLIPDEDTPRFQDTPVDTLWG